MANENKLRSPDVEETELDRIREKIRTRLKNIQDVTDSSEDRRFLKRAARKLKRVDNKLWRN